jgi:hypothetical protein
MWKKDSNWHHLADCRMMLQRQQGSLEIEKKNSIFKFGSIKDGCRLCIVDINFPGTIFSSPLSLAIAREIMRSANR